MLSGGRIEIEHLLIYYKINSSFNFSYKGGEAYEVFKKDF